MSPWAGLNEGRDPDFVDPPEYARRVRALRGIGQSIEDSSGLPDSQDEKAFNATRQDLPLKSPMPQHLWVMLLDLGDLKVRSWRKSDLDALVQYANNPKIAANLRDQFPHPYTRFAGASYLLEVRSAQVETSFAVEYGGEAIGGVGFKLGTDVARLSAEMGYWLGEPYWSRGLTTRAVLAASDWAFEHYRLTRIFAMAFSHNVASMRVLEKSGFEREGTLRRSAVKSGVILDQVLYAKVR